MSLKLKTGETKGLELECSECERNFVVESQVKSIRAMACPYCGVASETQNIEVA